MTTTASQPRLWRSRWAAIGAAVAVTFGAGGLIAVEAASSVPSSVVTVDPVRILDTRTGVGLSGKFSSGGPRKLQVTGAVVPAGATGVLLNVTAVAPSANGFLSVRPGDATGTPSTSSLNFTAGSVVPNSVQVALPTAGANAGQIDITYDAYGVSGPMTDVLADVVGYLVAGGLPGPAGPAGPVGPAGSAGARVIVGTGPLFVAPYDYVYGEIFCPGGTVAVGSGMRIKGIISTVMVYREFVGYFLSSDLGFSSEVEAQVVCLQGPTAALTDSALTTEGSSDEEDWARTVERLKQEHAELASISSDE
jgi:hypothetical protein